MRDEERKKSLLGDAEEVPDERASLLNQGPDEAPPEFETEEEKRKRRRSNMKRAMGKFAKNEMK